jgi:hypothetical protein
MKGPRLAPTLVGILLAAATSYGAAITVREPAFGLPHFFADTDLELARENGREIAKDRLVQMILLSRVGRGNLYQAFGLLDPTTLDDDVEARRTAYTSSELNRMWANLPQRERDAIMDYCKGVNDTIEAIYAGSLPEPLEINILRNVIGIGDDLFGNKTNISDQLDPNYAPPGGAWPNAGFQFTPEMVISVAILEVRNFGLNEFGEADRLAELQALIAKHGAAAGTEIWDDLNFLNDPLAPVSVPDATTPGYGGPLARRTDPNRLIALAERFPPYDYAATMRSLREAAAQRAEFAMSLGAWPMMGSYAWVIAGGKSTTDYPWLGGFPQTGIQTPSLMHFGENRSAEGADHRIQGLGMEFAGAPLVLIGQTDTVAYTSTTAQLRIIDTFLERIVNEDANTLSYVDEGTPTLVKKRTETFLGGPAPLAKRVFWRTHERNANGGTRAIVRFIGDRSGAADAGSSATALVDAAGNFDASFVNGYVAIVDCTGTGDCTGPVGQIRQISAVPNASTLTVTVPFATAPTSASLYVAVKPGNFVQGVAFDSPVWLEESTAALGFGLMQRAETVLDIREASRVIPSTHNFPSADNQPFNGFGTQFGNGNIAYYSSGFSRKRAEPRIPLDGTSATNPLIVASGTVASAAPTTLTAAGTPFAGKNLAAPAVNFRYQNPTQQGGEFVVAIMSGTGYKQSRRIASNDPSTLTVEYPWGVLPAAGDTFEVWEVVAMPEAINPAEGYLANWNNKAATADEGENFGRQFRHLFILERLAVDDAWDRDKQRQLNKDVAGLDGRGDYGRFLIPRLRQAVNAVGNGGNPAVDSVLAALEAHQGGTFLGRNYVDPVTATTHRGELVFLNTLVNRLALDIYGDEYGGAINVPTGGRALNIVQHAIDSKEGDVPGSYEQTFGGDYFQSFDPFNCYKAKRTAGTPAFPVQTVTLDDQFESGTFKVKRARALCAPSNKSDEGLRDAVTHLESYRITGTAPSVRQTGVVVRDEFGTLTVDTIRPHRLLVPTGKALGGPATAPTSDLDHFKCYRIRLTRGSARFPQGIQATVVDQFGDRLYNVRRPKFLCTPVSKDSGPLNDPETHLMCYVVKPAPGEPKHTPVKGQINTANQFGTEQLDTVSDEHLCVPAAKNPGNLRGWEVTVRNSLSALATGGIPADPARPNSRYRHPLAPVFPELEFPPTPSGNRGTYEQIVDVGPVVNGEFIFPLGQSGHIEGALVGGVTFIDPHNTTLHPLWRDWRFAPILHVSEDLVGGGSADGDGDGVFDGFERWYFGDLTHAGADDDDLDGATLAQEFAAGSDPTDSDTDDDGVPDGADSAPQDRLVS